jgi:hypothetical protein
VLETESGTDPFENFKAVAAWHVKVEDDQVREGKFRPVGVVSAAFEVRKGLFAIPNEFETEGALGIERASLYKRDIVGIVLNDQDDFRRLSCVSQS